MIDPSGLSRPCGCLCEARHPDSPSVCTRWGTGTQSTTDGGVFACCAPCGIAYEEQVGHQAGLDLQELAEATVQVNFDVVTICTLVHLIQRGCADPTMDDQSRQIGRNVAAAIVAPVIDGRPALAAWFARGWQSVPNAPEPKITPPGA